MKKIYSFFFLFLPFLFIGQTRTADSLKTLIKADKTDSAKVHHLVHLAFELEHLNNGFKINRSADSVYILALEKAWLSKSKMLEHVALSSLVSYHLSHMDCTPALEYCRQDSVVIAQMRNRSEAEQNLCHLAMIYERMPRACLLRRRATT